jgi:CheY-like chemotaxis protein
MGEVRKRMALPGVAGARVLVVDDDAATRTLLARILGMVGIDDVRLEPGLGALEDVVASFDPSLILLDLHLGEGSGFDALQRLEAHDPGRSSRSVVLMTGDAHAETRERALALGADEVLIKPYDVADVASLVERRLIGPAADRRAACGTTMPRLTSPPSS